MLVLILEAGRWCRDDVDAIMQAIAASQQAKCEVCFIMRGIKSTETIEEHDKKVIQQFKERLIEGMPKAESKCDYDQDLWDVAIECQRNDDIARIRAMAEKEAGK